jgi:ribose transport system substrate-binding protein
MGLRADKRSVVRFRPLAPLVRALPLALLAFAAGSASAGPKIGVLLKGRTSFWNAAEKGAEEAGAKTGAEVIVKMPPSETDVAIQLRLLAALDAEGIQALVIAPCSTDTLAAPVARLAAKGVKIVVIDSPLPPSVPSVFVGTDQRAAGQAAGALIAGFIADGDEVGIFRHNQNGGAAAEREIGAIDKLKELRPNAVIHSDIYASTEPGLEPQRAELLLSKYPHMKAVLATGTPGTMAMLDVLADQNAGIKFVGFGFNLNPKVAAAIAHNSMQGWIAQLPRNVGSKGVETAIALVGGQSVPPVVHTDVIVVTQSNLQSPDVQALLQ